MDEFEGFEYVINNDDTIEIVLYTEDEDETDIVIPNYIDDYPVTKIGYGAFYDFDWLQSVTIPETVKEIDDYAFSDDLYHDIIFYVVEGSYAHKFAEENAYDYEFIEASNQPNANYMKNLIEIGTIELKNQVILSDPCFKLDDEEQYLISNMKPGLYHCYVQELDNLYEYDIKSLVICHEDYVDKEDFQLNNIHESFCTESLMAGIFDYDYYKENKSNKEIDRQWFDNINNDIFDNNLRYLIKDNKCCVSLFNYNIVASIYLAIDNGICYSARIAK